MGFFQVAGKQTPKVLAITTPAQKDQIPPNLPFVKGGNWKKLRLKFSFIKWGFRGI
jgi:hypothetical protein